jgi:hypothetical protein
MMYSNRRTLGLVAGLVGVWLLVALLTSVSSTPPSVRAGNPTLDAAMFAILQATTQAQETKAARDQELASQRATASAIDLLQRQALATATREAHLTRQASNATATQVSANATATQAWVNATATQATMNAIATQISTNATATQVSTNATATQISINANATATQVSTNATATQVSNHATATQVSTNATATQVLIYATATAIAHQQSAADREAVLQSAGMIVALVGLGGMLVLMLGFLVMLLKQLWRRGASLHQDEPMPTVILVPPPPPAIVVDDPNRVDEITRALQNDGTDSDVHALTLDPTEYTSE